MLWYEALITSLVAWACIGGLWRHSGVALATSWCVGQVVYHATGNSLPIELYKIADPIVMFITWRGKGSKLDYAILAAFPFCWLAYWKLTGAEQWWTLWFITCLQLFLAGPIPQIQRGLSAFSHGPRRALQ